MEELNNQKIKELISLLKDKRYTVSTMESCTGGGLSNAITNIPGASDIFSFGAVTYSNQAKINLGGQEMKNVIDSFSVYSKETAELMAKTICSVANSTYGIGITGQLGTVDKNNNSGNNVNQVDFSIYDSINKTSISKHLSLKNIDRAENKIVIINQIILTFLDTRTNRKALTFILILYFLFGF